LLRRHLPCFAGPRPASALQNPACGRGPADAPMQRHRASLPSGQPASSFTEAQMTHSASASSTTSSKCAQPANTLTNYNLRVKNTFFEVNGMQGEETPGQLRRVSSEPSALTSGDTDTGSCSGDAARGRVFEDIPPLERWRNACYHLYCKGACNSAACPYAHDLSRAEVSDFLMWKGEALHTLFPSSSTERSSASCQSRNAEPGLAPVGLVRGDQGPQPGIDLSSDEEEVEDPEEPPQALDRKELTAQLLADAERMNQEELLAFLPRDAEGQPTSVGSILHERGQCKLCLFDGRNCPEGLFCRFCHFPHKRGKRRTKPCKGKRDSYKKLVHKISNQIDQDPVNFDLGSLESMPGLPKNEQLKRKLVLRIRAYHELACKGLPGDGTQQPPPLAGPCPQSAGLPAAASSGLRRQPHIVSL